VRVNLALCQMASDVVEPDVPFAPEAFFQLFDEGEFVVSAPRAAKLKAFSIDTLRKRLDPAIQELRISFMSSRYAEVFFEHTFAAPSDAGFTVGDVIELVHDYYTSVFTADEVAQIREKVARSEIDDPYVQIIARKPQGVLTWSLPAGYKEQHVDNFLAYFHLPRDGSLEDRMLRMAFHGADHKVFEAELQKACQLPFFSSCFWPIPSLSIEEVQQQCKALGLSDQANERKLAEHVQRGGALVVFAEPPSGPVQETCMRCKMMGGMQCFDGFSVDVVSPHSLSVSIGLGS